MTIPKHSWPKEGKIQFISNRIPWDEWLKAVKDFIKASRVKRFTNHLNKKRRNQV